jgi:hypothetical protein
MGLATNIQELANKGANFIIQPFTTPCIIQKHFNRDIEKFIDRITQTFRLPEYIFQEWKKYVLKQISQITQTILLGIPMGAYVPCSSETV